MRVIPLVSGGLDSSVMAKLIYERGLEQFPLFIDYGQLGSEREWIACQDIFRRHKLPTPSRIDVSGYGKFYPSGLTDKSLHIYEDAFLPGRNALFLLAGAAHAYQRDAASIALGLLNEDFSLFPDQTKAFTAIAEEFLSVALGRNFKVVTPLMEFAKSDVIRLAKDLQIDGTYSCHAGGEEPCGVCISCKEFQDLEG